MLTKTVPAQQLTARTGLQAFFLALPAIGLISFVVWSFVVTVTWLLASWFGGGGFTYILVGALTGAPAAWGTWKVAVSSTDAERHLHSL